MLDNPHDGLKISPTPLRRVINRGSVRVNGRFASRLMRKGIVWESQNEAAFLLRAELDPGVSAIYAQPVRLDLMLGARPRTYVPDFAVVYDDRTEIHEVKPDDEASSPEIVELARAAAHHVRLHGGVYSLALASELRAEPVFRNLKDLWRNLHTYVPNHTCTAMLDCAQSCGPAPVARLAELASQWGGSKERVLAMVAQRHLRLDLNCPVNGDSLVWAPTDFRLPTRLLPLRIPVEGST